MAKKHCSNTKQIIWTTCYGITWLMLLLGILIYHMAILSLAPTLADLPDNLADGFYKVFKFDLLEPDSIDTRLQSKAALAKCGVVPPCTGIPGAGSATTTGNATGNAVSNLMKTSSTGTEKAKIVGNFKNSLSFVMKVCNDQYFGTPELKDVGQKLDTMFADLDKIPTVETPCVATNVLYCGLYENADSIVKQMSTVTGEIDNFVNSEMVKTWKDNSDMLMFLHILPYMLVIAALFFACLWYRDGGCSKLGCCCFVLPFSFFWLLFFVINTIIFGAGLAIQMAADKVEIEVLVGKPTLDVFFVHLQTEYPEFWALVFADLEAGLKQLWNASLVFEAFSLCILAYGLCMCCCRPYRDAQDCPKVVSM